ncbi:TBC1 domain family member 20 [Trichogramma pretiosum]|uniref:TBC1 domain family member 20 n=1 Tax=Trichogramma pretiosum TaxID=7493 RepID=UPI0006C94B6D|nr:TBC1 domain family member 20 [Trichogramma pretiosum]
MPAAEAEDDEAAADEEKSIGGSDDDGSPSGSSRAASRYRSRLRDHSNGFVMSNEDSIWRADGPGVPDCPDIAHLHSTELERLKLIVIKGTISKPNLTLNELRLLSRSSEGLVHDKIRKLLWPKLLKLPEKEDDVVESLEDVHKLIDGDVYYQIQKDVARSNSHMPEDTPDEEMEKFQMELTQIICWVLSRHPELNYYQGYNDVAATVLLVMGLQQGLQVLEKISVTFLERFMEKTMEKVNQELFYIFALLDREHPLLLEHLENVELFPHFALAEYTTWYAHKYSENRKLLHRLFDFFLGSPPLIPLYLSTKIVAYRDKEIFNTTPDMGHTHKVLSTLPDDLPFEKLLYHTTKLYQLFPPDSIDSDVREFDFKRRRKEQEWKSRTEAVRNERERQRSLRVARTQQPKIPIRLRNYKTFTVVTILAFGLYAFLKTSSGLN